MNSDHWSNVTYPFPTKFVAYELILVQHHSTGISRIKYNVKNVASLIEN